MKINTHKSSSPRKSTVAIIVALMLIIAVAAGSFVYVYAFNGNLFGWSNQTQQKTDDADGVNYEAPTEEEVTTGSSIKQDSIENNKTSTPSSSLDLSITALNQTSDTLRVRVLIPSIVSSGTCTASLVKGSLLVSRSVETQALSNASTCKGFDIPLSELAAGKWNITVNFENETQKGTTSSTVEIK